ncbi:MAG: response regulator [Verrucomicrobiales bacterium]|nr:response regulator [Verrucomicrobiales bacterium]
MSRKASVLLVDDDAAFRDRLAKALVARGCRVVIAETAEAAMDAWSGDAFDGAVLDLRLVSGSGLALVPLLKARGGPCRIVVLTGFGSIATAMEAGRLGVAEYLTKPVDVDRLYAALFGAEPKIGPGEPESLCVPSLDRVEWEHIQRVLADCRGNVSRAARVLGIDRRSLQRKLAKYPPTR